MEINGYGAAFNIPLEQNLDEVLYDAWGTYDSLPFIAAHLASTQADEELVFDTLGVTEEAARDAYQRLTGEDRWPAFRIPLKNDSSLACVYRNIPESESIDFLVEFENFSPAIVLASIGDNFGPGISWPELFRVIYENPIPPPISPDIAFLLFLPMLSDASAGSEAVDIAADAISKVSGNKNSRELATELFEALSDIWGPAQWSLVDNDYLTCDVADSPRRLSDWDRQTLARITQALA